MPSSKSKLLRQKHNKFVKEDGFKYFLYCITLRLMSNRIKETGKIGELCPVSEAYDIFRARNYRERKAKI